MKKIIAIIIAIILIFAACSYSKQQNPAVTDDQSSNIAMLTATETQGGILAPEGWEMGDILYLSKQDADGAYTVRLSDRRGEDPSKKFDFIPNELLNLNPTEEDFKEKSNFAYVPKDAPLFEEAADGFTETGDSIPTGYYKILDRGDDMYQLEVPEGEGASWVKADSVNFDFGPFEEAVADEDPETYLNEEEKDGDETATGEEDHWANEFIAKVTDHDVMEAIDGEFFPDKPATRETILIGLAKIEESMGNKIEEHDKELFEDLKDKPYGHYAAWGQEHNIIRGYEDGRFRPEKEVTREELAAMIDRYITDYKKAPHTEELYNFNDADDIADWAESNVQNMANHGLVEGRDDGNFDPKANITKGEIAKIFAKIMDMDFPAEK